MDAWTKIYLRIPEGLSEKRWDRNEVEDEIRNLIKRQLRNRKAEIPVYIDILGWRTAHWSFRKSGYTGRGVMSLNYQVPGKSKLLEVLYIPRDTRPEETYGKSLG